MGLRQLVGESCINTTGGLAPFLHGSLLEIGSEILSSKEIRNDIMGSSSSGALEISKSMLKFFDGACACPHAQQCHSMGWWRLPRENVEVTRSMDGQKQLFRQPMYCRDWKSSINTGCFFLLLLSFSLNFQTRNSEICVELMRSTSDVCCAASPACSESTPECK